MTPVLVFRRSARADIAKAFNWYEERRTGLGDAFLLEVQSCLKYVLDRPKGFPRIHGEFRQALLHRFPYVMVYRPKGKTIVIMRVFHCSQDPSKKIPRKRI